MKRSFFAVLTVALMLLGLTNAWAAPSSVNVSGDTVDKNHAVGWMFNRDTATSTDFEFNFDEASTGLGSIEVLPISGTDGPDKFVAEYFAHVPVADVQSIAYDYLIAGDGTTADADQFYLNVYATTDDSDKFYDCRYDYTPADPADLSDFSTATFLATDTPAHVQKSATGRLATCPATLAEMPDGSHIRAFSINVGDTSTNDAGLAGHLDNAVVTTGAGATAYDFEPHKDACKNGYATAGFASQGACVGALQANGSSGK